MSEAIESPHVLAEELAESWINGNRKHVVGELASMPAARAAATTGYILASWYEDGSASRLHDARSLVKYLADRSEA